MSTGREIPFSCPIYTRQMRRQFPHALNGMGSSFDDKTNDFLCPICFEIISEAYITRCGHTYCYRCILKSLETNNRCPKCSVILSNADIFPNFLLNELICKYKCRQKMARELGGASSSGSGQNAAAADGLRNLVAHESKSLSLPDINVMLEALKKRKQHLEAESYLSQNRLLHEFLKNLLKLKERQLCDVTKEVSVIKKDLEHVEQLLHSVVTAEKAADDTDEIMNGGGDDNEDEEQEGDDRSYYLETSD